MFVIVPFARESDVDAELLPQRGIAELSEVRKVRQAMRSHRWFDATLDDRESNGISDGFDGFLRGWPRPSEPPQQRS